jgi:transketolase
VQEAAWLAAAWRLSRLTVVAGVRTADAPGLAGFAAAGWSVRRVDAGDPGDVAAAISAAQRSQRPTLIACIRAGRPAPAGAACSEEGIQAWREAGGRRSGVRRAWLKRLARHGSRQDFENAAAGRLPQGWHSAFFESGPLLPPGETAISTSCSLRLAMSRLAAVVPEVMRLPSDGCAKATGAQPELLSGCGAEGPLAQGLSAAATGLALHGGVLPVVEHRLAEADGLSAGMRAAAASGLRTLTVLIEPNTARPEGGQHASLRAIRNLTVFRPADASEALECAELALRRTTGPTVLLASDAPVKLLAERPSRTRCAKGGYVLAEALSRRATLIASGPELHLALAAHRMLADADTPVAVVSLPSWDVFARQELAWQETVLGDAPRIGLEAGSGLGWERWLGPDGLLIGLGHSEGIAWDASWPHASAVRLVHLITRHLGRRYPV